MSSMATLIVNADDAGLAASSDEVILRCAAAGIVRSASVVAGGPTAPAFVRRAVEAGLDLGLHLNLTEGPALAGPAPTLTDARGRFPGSKAAFWQRALAGEVNAAVLPPEIRAQWDALKALGATPSHLNGHNHVHVLPVVARAVASALGEACAGLWLRIPDDDAESPACQPIPAVRVLPMARDLRARAAAHRFRLADAFVGLAFCHEPCAQVLLDSLPTVPDGSRWAVELMVHPGRRPDSPFGTAPEREQEARVLVQPGLAARVRARGYGLASFSDVAERRPR